MVKKSLGQHWLIDDDILKNFAGLSSISKCDTVLEIGPGRGALTHQLLARCKHAGCKNILLIEKDDDLIIPLKTSFSECQIIHQDVLEISWDQFKLSERSLLIYGSLPYNVSVKVIKNFIHINSCIKEVNLIVQKEVADRLVAHSGKSFGTLSIEMQLYFDMQILFYISPSAFSPPPKVNSALIKLTPKEYPLINDVDNPSFLKKLSGIAFLHRRKMIKNTLKEFKELHNLIDVSLRPEEVNLMEWIRLANALCL